MGFKLTTPHVAQVAGHLTDMHVTRAHLEARHVRVWLCAVVSPGECRGMHMRDSPASVSRYQQSVNQLNKTVQLRVGAAESGRS